MSQENFTKEFVQCLQVPLVHGEKHRAVENTLNFASKFIASLLQTKPGTKPDDGEEEEEEELCPFVLDVLKFLFDVSVNTQYFEVLWKRFCVIFFGFVVTLFCFPPQQNHHTEYQAIRFRVCQFINKILNGLGNEACIDDNLCDQISECMMERLQVIVDTLLNESRSSIVSL